VGVAAITGVQEVDKSTVTLQVVMTGALGVHQGVKLEILDQLGRVGALLCLKGLSLFALLLNGKAGSSCSQGGVLVLLEQVEAGWLRGNILWCINIEVSVGGGEAGLTSHDGIHVTEGKEYTGSELLFRITDNPLLDHGAGTRLKDGSEIQLGELLLFNDVEGLFLLGSITELAVVA